MKAGAGVAASVRLCGRGCAAVIPRTRTIVTVSPHNPISAVFPGSALRAVNRLFAERGLE